MSCGRNVIALWMAVTLGGTGTLTFEGPCYAPPVRLMDVATDVVIGSGPSGYAAALGIIHAGRIPIVVDFGVDPRFDGGTVSQASTIAMKGEDSRARVFQYPRAWLSSSDGAQLPASSARGGLSNIWGAGILVRSRHDMPELAPVYDGIAAGYSALLSNMDVVGCQDRTSTRFPWIEGTTAGPQSTRYASIVHRLQAEREGVLFGHSRLALRARDCVRCGRCLTGCPEHLFFAAGEEIARLAASGKCRLVAGPVARIVPVDGLVRLEMTNDEILSERVFLAAGPIASPALLQRSGLAPGVIRVRDSAVFYAGFLNLNPAHGDESTYTASQAMAFSEVSGPTDFQLSFYDSNPEYAERLATLSPTLGRALKRASGLGERVNAAIGFLDSSVSGSLLLRHVAGRTWVTRQAQRGIWKRAVAVTRRVNAQTSRVGLHAIPGVVLAPAPGSGYHSGAGLPMGGTHVSFEGQLRAAPAVRIVDATSLPKVWAGSHTFTAMANAYRIASLPS